MDRRKRPGRKAWPQRGGGPQRHGEGHRGREHRDRPGPEGDRRDVRPRGGARGQRPREGRPYGSARPQRYGQRDERPRYSGAREDRPRHGSERGSADRRGAFHGDRDREGRQDGHRPYDRGAGQGGPRRDGPWQERPRHGGPRHEMPWQERPRQDRPPQDRPRQDRPRQDRPRWDGPRQGGWRPRDGAPGAVQAQAGEGAEVRQPVVRAKGRAGELGLDGHLRVVLEPIDMALAEQLPSRGGAPVLLPRGDRVGRVLSIVGTLQRPVATVELDASVREHALALRDREVHIH